MRVHAVLLVLLGLAPLHALADPVESLAWLSGCWASESGETGSGEMWTSTHGGALLGVSRTVKNGRLIEHEFMQIREIAPGKLAFIANPSGQRETTFNLVRSTANEWVFENPLHDFPQRVIYALDEQGVLRARIEGKRGKDTKVIAFPMRRIACPNQ